MKKPVPTLNQKHLATCKLPLVNHASGEQWYRIHQKKYSAIFFSPPDGSPPVGRFDDPQSQYRVCYLGLSPYAVVAEGLLHSPKRRILSLADLDQRSYATVLLQREVTLVQLHGPGLNMLDITADIVASEDYDVCGALARSLYERSESVDGLEYRSRHDNGEIAIALFDRAQDAIVLDSTVSFRSTGLLTDIITRYGVSLS